MAIINTVIYILEKQEDNIDQTAVIVVVSVIGGVLGLPLVCFLGFHIFLSLTGSTTRELIKEYSHDERENQWCDVADPLFDPF